MVFLIDIGRFKVGFFFWYLLLEDWRGVLMGLWVEDDNLEFIFF